MTAVDVPPDLIDEGPLPYAAVSELAVPQTVGLSDRVYTVGYASEGELVIHVEESGPPVDGVILVAVPSDVDDNFDPVIPFTVDGTIKARLTGEAPDFELEWDF